MRQLAITKDRSMTVKTALIGYTGFVGSNIAAAHEFTDIYQALVLVG